MPVDRTRSDGNSEFEPGWHLDVEEHEEKTRDNDRRRRKFWQICQNLGARREDTRQ
jgi:hypothetical protein